MKLRFNSFDVVCGITELQSLVGLRVNQIYDVDSKTYLIRLQGRDEAKKMILIESGTRFHTTTFNWPKNITPSGFSMKLRKHLKNKRLEKLQQIGADRIVDFQFGTGEAAYHIIVELYDRGNIILTDHETRILYILRPHNEGESVQFAVYEKYSYERAKKPSPLPSCNELAKAISTAKPGDNLKSIIMPMVDCGPIVLEHVLTKHKLQNCIISKDILKGNDESCNVAKKKHTKTKQIKGYRHEISTREFNFESDIKALVLACQEEDCRKQRIVRRRLRDASNPLELPDALFIQHYRINKDAFLDILEVLDHNLPTTKTSFGITTVIKLCSCLRLFAEGGYQKGVARDYEVGLVQSTFSEVLSQVLDVLEQKLCGKWITYPTDEESAEIAQELYRKFGIPGVVGCIDGTHINIVGPKENKHLYYNRKGTYSLNATLICGSRMRIRFVDATHPGACHDSFVWNTSPYKSIMEQNFVQRGLRIWLLGDAGYPLQPWLLTPYRTTTSGSVQRKFNDFHSKCRNIIERTNGVLKGRWRCLLGAIELHYEPKKAVKIVNVCVVLHNICISCGYNRDAVEVSEQMEIPPASSINSAEGERYLATAQRARDNVANSL